jgi:SOS-response transcriptional repressor LexA
MTPGEKMQLLRVTRRPKMTQTDMADVLGTTRTVIANFESGRTEPPRRVVAKLSQEWRIPESWFWDEMDTPVPTGNALADAMVGSSQPHINLVPYWGEVPCGGWDAPRSDPEMIQISEAIDPKNIVVVRVVGNSMLPLFRHGQRVAVRLSKEPVDGVVHLCHNQDGELTLKVTRYVQGEWQLHPVNPDYPVVTAEKWTVLGRAVHVEESDPAGLRP